MHHVWRQARDTRLPNSRRICQSRKVSLKSRKQGSITKWIFRTTVHYRLISRRPNRRMAPTKPDSTDNFYNGPYYQKLNRQRNSAYTLSSDERITTMEAELFNLKKAREVQVAAVRTQAQHQNRAPANNTDEQDVQQARKAIPRIDEVEEAAPRHPTVSISNSQPTIPEHPYRNARDAAYAPPVNRNVAAPYKPSNDKRPELAYKTLPPVHDPTIAANVYKRSMDAPITIMQRDR